MKKTGTVAVVLLLAALLIVMQGTRAGRRLGRETVRNVRKAAGVVYPQPVMTLSIWHGSRAAAFRVELYQSGRLVAHGAHKSERQLGSAVTTTLIDLARTAAGSDFNIDGCNTAAEGLNAELSLLAPNGTVMRVVCRNAASWPHGPNTRRFLDGMEANLPDDVKGAAQMLTR